MAPQGRGAQAPSTKTAVPRDLTEPLCDAHHIQRSVLWELPDRAGLPFAL